MKKFDVNNLTRMAQAAKNTQEIEQLRQEEASRKLAIQQEAEQRNQANAIIEGIPDKCNNAAAVGEFGCKIWTVNDLDPNKMSIKSRMIYDYCIATFGKLRVDLRTDSYKQYYYIYVNWLPINEEDLKKVK